jgi:hypothetical protein
MKRIILCSILLLLVGVVCASLGYRAGSHRRNLWVDSTFVGTFDALKRLRAGETASGIARVEAMCFSAAYVLYDNPKLRDDVVTKLNLKELRDYRATYRTNSADWYPTEQQLERVLGTWK